MLAAHLHRRINTHGILVTAACVLIGLMAAQPLLYGNLPFGAFTLLHPNRVMQLDELVRPDCPWWVHQRRSCSLCIVAHSQRDYDLLTTG